MNVKLLIRKSYLQKYITALIVLIGQSFLFAQTCDVTIATSSPTTVCPGTVVNLTASATVYNQNQNFDFNIGSLPSGWSIAGGASFGTPCGAGPSGSYYWASTAGGGTPYIQTAGFDICTGGEIVFDMRYAIQGQGSPCEGPDEQDEGVSIQYSLDGGATWIEFVYYSPDGSVLPSNPGGNTSIASGNTPFTTWSTITVPIPPGAVSPNTIFRWIQTNSSGSTNDNWGIDNVFINSSACLSGNINWNTGDNGVDNIAPTINQDSCIVAEVYDDLGNFLCAAAAPICFTVFVPSIDGGPDRTICEGTSTTLTASGGSGFTWDNGVTDGVPFTPPLGTTTYTVSGTDVNGCLATDQVDITVIPGASITVDAGPDQNICIGESVTLTATGATTYVWDNGGANGQTVSPVVTTTYLVTGTTGSCQDDDAITINVSTSGTPTFDPIADVCQGATPPVLPATSTNGVNGTWSPATVSTSSAGTFTFTFTPNVTCATTEQITVTVTPSPIVNPGAPQVVCDGETVTLTASGATTYVWDNGVTNGVAFTPPAGSTTMYTVIGESANGCTSTDSVQVTSSAIPVVDAGMDQTICLGESVTLTASGATTYIWDNGGANGQSVSPLSTVTYNVTGNIGSCQDDDDVTITVIDPITPTFDPIANVCVGASAPVLPGTSTNGIVGTWSSSVSTAVAGTTNYTFTPTPPTCNTTAQISITIDPLPYVDAGADQIVCDGDPVTLNAAGATSYVWDNGVVDGTQFTPAATTTYTVIGTDVNGCQNTDSLEVVVSPLPIVDAGPDLAICIGASTTLTATGANSYVWDNGGANGQSVSPIVTTTYTVVGSVGSCTDDDEVTITINPLPQVEFTPDVVIGCDPLEVNFTVQSPLGVSCAWDFGDGATDVGCGVASHTYNGIGCYDVRMTTTDANGCVNSQNYSNLICLVEYPIADFNINPAVVTTTYPVSTMVNASQGAVSYLWDFGDGSATSTNTEPVHTFPFGEGDSYEVTLVVDNGYGCTDTAYRTITVEEDIIFYVPNTFTPDGDSYNQTFQPIFTSGFDPFDYSLFIYNRWGELVFESHNAEIGWDGKYAGSYEVQDGTYTWKIEFKQSINDKRRTEMGHVNIIR